ncbi:unnamed protein product [Vitrella brassicaformis CCMP3155]|uniref:Uncharacterized protein n=1 Tax=Vitrella brassicaformis (strain CCMP3155) TaxID=1169540 RepID=A0A0G4ED85_VITBC|nr:unnamed protein product [Vitrella brassicaformis CCMP3155]|eukprot:CEL93519.1 unnamed protein product [Vitrella brassicaformis CCMP3155]
MLQRGRGRRTSFQPSLRNNSLPPLDDIDMGYYDNDLTLTDLFATRQRLSRGSRASAVDKKVDIARKHKRLVKSVDSYLCTMPEAPCLSERERRLRDLLWTKEDVPALPRHLVVDVKRLTDEVNGKDQLRSLTERSTNSPNARKRDPSSSPPPPPVALPALATNAPQSPSIDWPLPPPSALPPHDRAILMNISRHLKLKVNEDKRNERRSLCDRMRIGLWMVACAYSVRGFEDALTSGFTRATRRLSGGFVLMDGEIGASPVSRRDVLMRRRAARHSWGMATSVMMASRRFVRMKRPNHSIEVVKSFVKQLTSLKHCIELRKKVRKMMHAITHFQRSARVGLARIRAAYAAIERQWLWVEALVIARTINVAADRLAGDYTKYEQGGKSSLMDFIEQHRIPGAWRHAKIRSIYVENANLWYEQYQQHKKSLKKYAKACQEWRLEALTYGLSNRSKWPSMPRPPRPLPEGLTQQVSPERLEEAILSSTHLKKKLETTLKAASNAFLSTVKPPKRPLCSPDPSSQLAPPSPSMLTSFVRESPRRLSLRSATKKLLQSVHEQQNTQQAADEAASIAARLEVPTGGELRQTRTSLLGDLAMVAAEKERDGGVSEGAKATAWGNVVSLGDPDS